MLLSGKEKDSSGTVEVAVVGVVVDVRGVVVLIVSCRLLVVGVDVLDVDVAVSPEISRGVESESTFCVNAV